MLNSIVNRMFGSDPKPAMAGPDSAPRKKESAASRKSHFCQLLNIEQEQPSAAELKRLWKCVEQHMAVVPSGPVSLRELDISFDEVNQTGDSPRHQMVQVESFYIDKWAVTNSDYLQFVKAGCYENTNLWDQSVWSKVTQFVDLTGAPGPKNWEQGKPAREKMDHPVVGICWYEAQAYAHWVGKQLPNSAQWQRAATWHHSESEDGFSTKFTWGGTYEPAYANTWASGIGDTVSVSEYYNGATPNGVFQLIGNTWEWVDGDFAIANLSPGQVSDLVEIRGGAFDSYLDSQMTCQFRSGLSRSQRSRNLGFRCVVPVKQLHRPQ